MSAEISSLATAYEHGDFVWVPGSEMAGDGLTKWGHNRVLCRVIANGEWALADNDEAHKLRRLAASKKFLWRKASKTVQQ